jgi:hypothetical protein
MPVPDQSPPPSQTLVELKLQIPEDLYRAFQRCLWVRINETGQTQLQLMEEVIHNFLKKHGC